MNTIKKVLEGVYENPELRRTSVPLFLGNPGLGKTKMIEQFAESKGVNLVEFITSQRNPFEISGMGMPDKDTKKMSIWDFDTLLEMKDGDILFFDEILNGNPVVLNACLTLLEQRKMISGKKLPDIMIVAAANPQGVGPLTPQIKERFIWYDIKFNPSLWSNYMNDKYFMPKIISEKLIQYIKNEDFSGNNFMTPRSIEKAINYIIHKIPTPYESKIKPVLETLIENPLGKKVDLGSFILEKEERISWLKLIQIKNGKVTK